MRIWQSSSYLGQDALPDVDAAARVVVVEHAEGDGR
jgi:hypothetical protein